MKSLLQDLLRRNGRDFILSVLGTVSMPQIGIHILGGHKSSTEAGGGTLSDRIKFEKLLNKLSKYCNFVNIEDAITLIQSHAIVDKPTIAFTFDDGFSDCYDVIAPVLESYGINALFFINPNAASAASEKDENYIAKFANSSTNSPGKVPMSWEQILDLHKRGFKFGAHTMDHYMLNHGSSNEIKHQIVDCKAAIETKINTTCDCFAWPYGTMTHINEEALSIAIDTYPFVFSQCDYKHYFSCNGQVINRRHFEIWWKYSHVKYFLSCKKE